MWVKRWQLFRKRNIYGIFLQVSDSENLGPPSLLLEWASQGREARAQNIEQLVINLWKKKLSLNKTHLKHGREPNMLRRLKEWVEFNLNSLTEVIKEFLGCPVNWGTPILRRRRSNNRWYPIQPNQIQANITLSNSTQSHPRIKPLSMAITINSGRWHCIHKRTAPIQLTTSIRCKCHHKKQ